MKEARITLDLWHEFSELELRHEGNDLVQALDCQERLLTGEKAHREEFKKEMEEVAGRIRTHSGRIRQRGMLRATECRVLFHKPAVGTKTVVREDTGEVVEEKAMTPSECQENLFRETTEKAAEEAEAAGA